VLGTTKLAGVPETVVTVPLPKVVERKSNVNADAVIVNALDAIDAEMGWICGTVAHEESPRKKVDADGDPDADIFVTGNNNAELRDEVVTVP
jgi:hypothetical protein